MLYIFHKKKSFSTQCLGRQHNHTEVVAEDARKQLPRNFESRQQQADWLAAQAKCQAEADKKGLDYKRIKLLNVSAVEAANIDKKKSKRNPDIGFSDYEAMTARQYKRLVGQMEPMPVEKYNRLRAEMGDANFYSGINTMSQGMHGHRLYAKAPFYAKRTFAWWLGTGVIT